LNPVAVLLLTPGRMQVIQYSIFIFTFSLEGGLAGLQVKRNCFYIPFTFIRFIIGPLMKKNIEILRNPYLCYGCKTCQLMCSFHHTKCFWPDHSSIYVYRNPQNNTVKWSIDYKTCDGCIGEGEPLCEKYCPYGAIRCRKNHVENKKEKKE